MNKTALKHFLVFRFSSLGDIAMTVPVIRLLLQQHTGIRITMVSNDFVRPLFKGIDRLEFYAVDKKGKHRGIKGMYRLFKELETAGHVDGVADLHDVLRTKLLRTFFYLKGNRVAVIDKGRKEKKELTRKKNKKLHPLKSNFLRYAGVFSNLGYPIKLNAQNATIKLAVPGELARLKDLGHVLIGIAPFALHKEKTYPAEKMKQLIRLLSKNSKLKLFLIGGRDDAEELETWFPGADGVVSWAGKMDFQKELNYISSLDLMVSMDSANMHLASMFGVPVVSIWGGTHPYLGFYGWGQSPINAVQVDLECRPSSVFGNKPCHNDLACMNMISPIVIFEKIIRQLNLEHYEISRN